MEFNQETEDLNFKLEHTGVSITMLSFPGIVAFKLFKNKNGFFTNYKPIEINEAIKENKNIITLHKEFIDNNKPKVNFSRLVRIPNKPSFQPILLSDGRIIDPRRIKVNEKEIIEIFVGMFVIYINIMDANYQKIKRTITIIID